MNQLSHSKAPPDPCSIGQARGLGDSESVLYVLSLDNRFAEGQSVNTRKARVFSLVIGADGQRDERRRGQASRAVTILERVKTKTAERGLPFSFDLRIVAGDRTPDVAVMNP
jgi:hypothetical protein